MDSSSFQNVVVIPDVHGDSESFIRSLWISLVDVEDTLIEYSDFRDRMLNGADKRSRDEIVEPVSNPISVRPAETLLVQLGDIADRGPDTLLCYWLMDVVEPLIGWTVRKLYGNHELLSLQQKGPMYVHPLDLTKFEKHFGHAGARAEQFDRFGKLWSDISRDSLLMVRFGDFSQPKRPSLDVLPLSAPDSLFVHGGVETEWIEGVKETFFGRMKDETIVDDLNAFTEGLVRGMSSNPSLMRSSMYSSSNAFASLDVLNMRQSPLWVRDTSELNEAYVCSVLLDPILKYFSVARMIVGHTPQNKRMVSRCGSMLILADSSVSKWMRQQGTMEDLDADRNPEYDGEGELITGNPSVLILKQDALKSSGGKLLSMHGVYFDEVAWLTRKNSNERALLIRENYFPLDVPERAFKSSLMRRSGRINNFATSTRSKPVPSSYTCEGMLQALPYDGRDWETILLRYMNPDKVKPTFATGLPEVRLVNQPQGWKGQFQVMMDACGPNLREVIEFKWREITLTTLRQIFNVIKSLENLGLDFAFQRSFKGHDPLKLFEKFNLDNLHRQIVLTDLDMLQLLQAPDISALTIETRLAPVIAEIQTILSEIFPFSVWELFNIARVAKDYWPHIRTQMLNHKVWAIDLPVGGIHAPELEKEWAYLPLGGLWNSQRIQTEEVVFKVAADEYRSGVLLQLKNPLMHADELSEWVESMDQDIRKASGIPPIVKHKNEENSTGYILFDFVGHCIKHSADITTSAFDIANAMFRSVKTLHKVGFLLGLPIDNTIDIREFFYVSTSLSSDAASIRLIDLSLVHKPTKVEQFDDELEYARAKISALFPTVLLDDSDDGYQSETDSLLFYDGLVEDLPQEDADKSLDSMEKSKSDTSLSTAISGITDSEGPFSPVPPSPGENPRGRADSISFEWAEITHDDAKEHSNDPVQVSHLI